MPVWAYKGFDARGKPVTGAKDADTPKLLRATLRRDGIVVTDVTEARAGKSAAAAHGKGLRREVDLRAFLGSVKRTEIAAFTRQLATLLKAGIPLAEALGALFEQVDNPRFKTVVGDIRTRVNEGSSLADAIARHGNLFAGVYASMVRGGETAGNLDQVLLRLAEFLESQAKLRSKVTGAMIYPMIMVVVATAVLAILMIAVVPKITAIYADTDKTLPWNTLVLIAVSSFLGNFWYLALLAVVLGFFAFRAWRRSPKGRAKWDRWVLGLPIAGPIARQIAIGRFTRTFGTMLASGVPLLRALDVSKEILGNTFLVKVVDDARERIQQGESIAVALKRSGQFPPVVTHMIAVGERSGALEGMLANVADAYESETEMKLGRMTSLLEPLMIVLMGGTVAFVVFSILMPMMDMNPT
jgi:general secretion pathway protein F